MKKLDKFINNRLNKYYYNFDYIMHEFIIRKFIKKKLKKNCLELGAGFGNFTKLISNKFKEITVVEGSEKSINSLKKLNIKNLKIYQQDLEKLKINKKFHYIFLIHTLEHLKKRQKFLNMIHNNLFKNGKLLVVCPNANSASRQIAVKMGLIKKERSVTKSEKNHGHYITYDIKSLISEFKNSSLKIIDHGGICFKPMANFQIDTALKKKIINKDYLEACFKIGEKYPDLCSSIYIVAKLK